MTRKNFETGVSRLFYVAWAVLLCSGVLTVIDVARSGDWTGYDFSSLLMLLIALLILPPVAMVVVRWIYHGFMPKP